LKGLLLGDKSPPRPALGVQQPAVGKKTAQGNPHLRALKIKKPTHWAVVDALVNPSKDGGVLRGSLGIPDWRTRHTEPIFRVEPLFMNVGSTSVNLPPASQVGFYCG
jgi:hypothetical protein